MQIHNNAGTSPEGSVAHSSSAHQVEDFRRGAAHSDTMSGPPTPTTSTSTQAIESAPSSSSPGPASTRDETLADEQTLDSREFSVKYWFDEDGRANMRVRRRSTFVVDTGINSQEPETQHVQRNPDDEPPPYQEDNPNTPQNNGQGPFMNIVMHAAGSLPELSHFVSVAKCLQTVHGHRVRITTHPEFREQVEHNGVEFFDIGVPSGVLGMFLGQDRSQTLIPRVPSEENVAPGGKCIPQLLKSCWRACIAPGPDGRAFAADVIIANPLSCAYMHCAEKLGVPLHLMSASVFVPSHPSCRTPC